MTGLFLLDWPLLALSLFNTILMTWLGLTVLLTAERRAWGVWVIGCGLLLGGAFFVSHTAILGLALTNFGPGLNFWWRVGWGPVVALPFAWYVIVLWYAGFWEGGDDALKRRQRWPFRLTVALAVGLVGLLVFANPLPSLWQIAVLNLTATPEIAGLPLLIVAYPIYIVLCIALSLDALWRPGPSARVMGDLARRRARPWLVSTAVIFLVISLLVGAAMVWVVVSVRARPRDLATDLLTLGWLDLVIDALIALAVILLGQAVVAYEVFTGKTLPRRGLLRYWRNAVILAAGFGVVVSGALTIQLRPIYSVLLTTLLMTAFYALSSWRAFVERERSMRALRPFVASQQLYEHLLTPSVSEATTPPETDIARPFRALCENILGTRTAFLMAVGPLAPLVGPPLAYPASASSPSLSSLVTRLSSPQVMIQAIDSSEYAGATWAVPLWSERGLIGALLLGEKVDGSLYTQEEIETARATGERLIDTQASAEMAHRLMALQRQRLAENQVVDRQTRRALHDDVLPRLHAAMLALNQTSDFRSLSETSEVLGMLTDVHRQISDLLRAMPSARLPEVTRLGLLGALRQTVDDDLGRAFDTVTWQVEPDVEAGASALPALALEVVFHAAREAIRNAARHGRTDAHQPLRLTITAQWREGLRLIIEDDGAGVDGEKATSAGSGQGLALHSTLLAVVGGTLAVESEAGKGTRVVLGAG